MSDIKNKDLDQAEEMQLQDSGRDGEDRGARGGKNKTFFTKKSLPFVCK